MKTTTYIILPLLFFLTNGCNSGSSDQTTQESDTTAPISLPEETTSTTPEENVTTQQPTLADVMTLKTEVPTTTPLDEFICIDFNDENPPLPMTKTNTNEWEINITQSSMQSMEYKYCRNCECEAADEEFIDSEIGWRELSYKSQDTQTDIVNQWRWLHNEDLNFQLNTAGYQEINDTKKSNFIAGVMLIDWFKSSWLAAVDSTMKKIATQTNATWVQYTPIPEITQLYPTPIIVKNASNGTSDEELIQIIQSAHKYGLKVFLNPSPWSFQEDNSTQNHSQEWWDAFEAQWEPIMLDYAKLAAQQNVEMLEFKMWPNIDALTNDEKDKMDTLATKLLEKTKEVYNGEIAVQSICYDVDRPILDVHRQSDYITMNIWSYYPWHLGETKDDNVTQIAAIVREKLSECKAYYDDYNLSKPVIVEQLSAASYDGDIVGLNDNAEAIDSFHKNDPAYTLDLQEQADVYEAVLQEVSKDDWIVGNFAFTYFYWDSVGKDINIRAKPAKDVMAKWYGWMKN